jgi:hypothetical protein
MSINYFDEIFFSNYIKKEWEAVLDVCHKHLTTILDTIIMGIFFGVILPTFFYYNDTFGLKTMIPFMFYEVYLFVSYIFLIYKIFDWYNDVWIITDKWIIDLDWELLKTNIVYIEYNDVKWIELHQASMWDWMMNKWTITLHLLWEWPPFKLDEARNPREVINYIQEVLEEKEKAKKNKDQSLTDRLFSTLRWVIKDHLEKEWVDLDEDGEESDTDEEKALNKALHQRWTVDLRADIK